MEKGKVGYFDVRKFFYNHWDNLPRDPDQLELLIKYCKSINSNKIYLNTKYIPMIFDYEIKEDDCIML
jgi:hypothetical protein